MEMMTTPVAATTAKQATPATLHEYKPQCDLQSHSNS